MPNATGTGVQDFISQMFGQASAFLPPGLGAWVARIQTHYVSRWRPYEAAGIPCRVLHATTREACVASAMSTCYFCSSPVCLHHSAVAENGMLVCFPCLQKIPMSKPADAPPPRQPAQDYHKLVVDHLRTLGLREPSSLEEIQQAYRELARKHHPDKGGDAAKMKSINAANDWLRANYKPQGG